MGAGSNGKKKKKAHKTTEQTRDRTQAKRSKDREVEKTESSALSSEEEEVASNSKGGKNSTGSRSQDRSRRKNRSIAEDPKKRSIAKKKKIPKTSVNIPPRGPPSPEPNVSSSDSSRRRKCGAGCVNPNSLTGTGTASGGPQAGGKKKHGKQKEAPQPSCGAETTEETAWNEVADAEAEKPFDVAPDVVVREGFVLGIKGKKYRFLETIDQDYGVTPVVNVPTDGSTEKVHRYTMNYEITSAKLRRLKVQATILALAAASTKIETHFFRITVLGHAGNLKFLMTEEHGPTLAELVTGQGNSFSPPTAFKMGLQTLEAIEELHNMGYVCRDIKPQAFAIGRSTKHMNNVYLIHVGLGRRVGADSNIRSRVPFFGSKRYCSRRTHLEEERGRGDDLESWLYMFVEFFNERALSWRSLHNKNAIHKDKTNFFSITGFEDVKKKTKCLPESFYGRVVDHIFNLKVEETPDYNTIAQVLRDEVQHGGFQKFPYDWDTVSTSNAPTMGGGGHQSTLPGVNQSVLPFSRLPTARQI
uniref:Protein kinase domain-containing protein n=1 Tax=Panagrellus redivivus TaxID=6233 RepID=A0A7E4UUA9_PANRE